MNLLLLNHELLVLALALGVLLVDLWLPLQAKRKLGYAAAIGVGLILLYSLFWVEIPTSQPVQYAFGQMYALDDLALFFKRFFLLAALIVLLMSVEFADRIVSGIAEFYTPEELIGKRIAIIANLAPRKMRGLESHGMLLAASGEDHSSKPILATFSDEIALGSRIR